MTGNVVSTFIAEQSSIYQVPGIGRRTAQLLYEAGIKTVGAFTRLPDLLLEATFGPSLPSLRQQTISLLEQSSQQQFTSALKRFVTQHLLR